VDQHRLDELALPLVERFRRDLGPHLAENCPQIKLRVEATGQLNDEQREVLIAAIDALLAHIQSTSDATA